MNKNDPRIEFKVHFQVNRRGRKRAVSGETPATDSPEQGRLPRVTRLMALAIRFDGLIRDGEVRDLAEVARLGHVTRARVTQVMNLLHLAPDLQEAILNLPRVEKGRETITERELRPIAALVDWRKQRLAWRLLSHSDKSTCTGAVNRHNPPKRRPLMEGMQVA
ncbi:MAG TPA: hypothetical protein PKE29_01570 [Phycisphaerales bacterium]|nr:hypothetical protein [Phycisphaerales bacterium]